MVWALRGEQDEPTAAVPSLSSRTGVTVNSGETSVVLTVPPGTAPQFLVVTAETDNGKVGEAQISVTSQVIGPAGPLPRSPLRYSVPTVANSTRTVPLRQSYRRW